MKKINFKNLGLTVLLVILSGNAWMYFLSAGAVALGDVFLIVQPQKTEIKGSPGSKFKDQIALVNRSDSTMNFRIRVADFRVGEENKKGEFYEAGENSMKLWVIPEFLEISLKPMEAKNIKFITAIPEKIKSGSYFGAILLEPLGKDPGPTFGTLLLVNVIGGEGMAVTGGKIEEFSASKIQSYPVRFEVRLANLGNTYLKTEGKITLKDWRNRNIAELEGEPQLIYPDNAGLVKWKWNNDDLKFGLFRAELELSNLQNKDNKLSASTWFLILPWKRIVAGILAAALSLFFLFKYRRKFSFLWRFLSDLKIRKMPLPGFKKTV